MKPCPYCGKELPEEMQFCPYCMEKFVQETPVGPSPSPKASLWWLGLVAAAILILGLLVWLLWPRTQPGYAPGQAPTTPSAGDSGEDTATAEKPSPTDGVDEPTGEHAGDNTGTTAPIGHTDPTRSTTTGKSSQTTTKTTKKTGTTTQKTDKKTSTTKITSTTKKTSATEALCANGHDWTDFVETVHHEEVGHYEEQATKSTRVTIYKCAICYQKHDTLDDYYAHFDAQHADTGPNIHLFRDRYETDTELRPIYEQVWVVDQEAYDEIIGIRRRCKRCGKTKQNP